MVRSKKNGDGKVISRLNILVAEKESREGRRITQREIVAATGLNPNTVSRWMSPEPIEQFTSKTVVPLCRFLECQIGDLLHIDYQF